MSRRWKMVFLAPLAILAMLLFAYIGGELVMLLVELAAAAAVRLALDHILASTWPSGALPHPLRRIRKARFRAPQFSPAHERAMWEHDPRGAGTISASHARTLGVWDVHRGEQTGMKAILSGRTPSSVPTVSSTNVDKCLLLVACGAGWADPFARIRAIDIHGMTISS